MKNLFLIVSLLFVSLSFGQHESYDPTTFEPNVSETTATVKFVNDSIAVFVTRNGIYTYQTISDKRMKKGWEYILFGQKQKCEDCKEKIILLQDFYESPRQTYKNINFLREKHKIE